MEVKLNFVFVLFFSWTFNIVYATLEPCIKSVQSKVCLLVDDIQDYVSTVNPEPLPTQVDVTLKYGFCNKSFRKDETLTS